MFNRHRHCVSVFLLCVSCLKPCTVFMADVICTSSRFSCYRRLPLFRNVTVCQLFLHSLERIRPDFCSEFGSEWWNYIPRSRKYGETWGTQISVPLLYRCRVVTLLPDFGEVG